MELYVRRNEGQPDRAAVRGFFLSLYIRKSLGFFGVPSKGIESHGRDFFGIQTEGLCGVK